MFIIYDTLRTRQKRAKLMNQVSDSCQTVYYSAIWCFIILFITYIQSYPRIIAASEHSQLV